MTRAVENLRHHQRQLDADGIEVGVSRQALERVLEEHQSYKNSCHHAGVCMTCVVQAPEPYGCSDCLNTGWQSGSPTSELLFEIQRLRKEYQTISMLDHGRRQMLDHFEKLIKGND